MKKIDKKEKSRYDPEKYIEINPTDDVDPVIKEAMNRTAVITFGRMNPLQQGHEKLVNKLVSVASKEKAIPLVYLSHTQDKKKNPLTYTDKLKFAKIAFGPIVKESQAKTILQAVKELQNNFNRLILVVGSDRVSEFDTLLNKYNGTEYKFDEIKVISAGTRDPDADDIAGMSASKMRTLAMEGNFKQFKNALPTKLRDSAEVVYKSVREGMGIMEDYVENDLDEARQPLTIAQRRRRGMTMRRYRSKIKMAREKAKRRMATPEKLKLRAQRKARGIIRDRLMKSKKYSEMTPAEKVALDKRLVRIPPAVISRIATRQLPVVRKAEMQRLADRRSPKTEELDFNELFEQFVNEPDTKRKKKFRYLFTREGKVNYDQRFKMYRPRAIMGENLEDALYELIEAVEKIDKDDPLNREEGSDSLVKILKADTPGENLDEVKMVPPLKHSKTTVPDFVGPSTPDIAALVSKQNKHQLGIGLNLKQMIKHALMNKDTDNDGDVGAQDMNPVGGGELVADPSFDKTKTPSEATKKMQQKYEKEKQHTKVGLAFEGRNYYTGLAKSTAAKRKSQFEKQAKMDDDNPAAYKPAPGDARAETKPSVHTKRYKDMFGEHLSEAEQMAGIKKKAEETGISYGILKKVFDRGVAAWRTGHRPGTTPSQWGYARINSFATGGKTRTTADADLWAKHKGK